MRLPVRWRSASVAIAFAAALPLASCGGGDPTPAAAPTPTPTPTASATFAYDVSRCMDQIIPNASGRSLKTQIIPDTVKLDFNNPNGFPNGRDFDDPVIDTELAMFFLDLTVTGQGLRTFADLPLNPGGNDAPYRSEFPYIGAPQGTPPLPDTSPSTYNFRTDPDSAYVRVDRMGQPAIATVLVSSTVQNSYNDHDPSDDAAGLFEKELRTSLATLNIGIGDDLTDLGLKLCARKI
jgi:hypothetical protein